MSRVLCKDQATYDALMAVIDKYPDSLGHIKNRASVITPEELMTLVGNIGVSHDVAMVDMNVVSNIERHEKAHAAMVAAGREPKGIDLIVPNTSEGFVGRISRILEKQFRLPAAVYAEIQDYLTSIVREDGKVMVTEEVVLRLEEIYNNSKPEVIGVEILAKKVRTGGVLPGGGDFEGDRWPMDFYAAPTEKSHSYDLPSNSKKETVVSKSGYRYPRPKRKW